MSTHGNKLASEKNASQGPTRTLRGLQKLVNRLLEELQKQANSRGEAYKGLIKHVWRLADRVYSSRD